MWRSTNLFEAGPSSTFISFAGQSNLPAGMKAAAIHSYYPVNACYLYHCISNGQALFLLSLHEKFSLAKFSFDFDTILWTPQDSYLPSNLNTIMACCRSL